MKLWLKASQSIGMPIQTANFYDSFRYGNLPIGVSNFETYIKLMTAAPELCRFVGYRPLSRDGS